LASSLATLLCSLTTSVWSITMTVISLTLRIDIILMRLRVTKHWKPENRQLFSKKKKFLQGFESGTQTAEFGSCQNFHIWIRILTTGFLTPLFKMYCSILLLIVCTLHS
jgi:hypothetical protein